MRTVHLARAVLALEHSHDRAHLALSSAARQPDWRGNLPDHFGHMDATSARVDAEALVRAADRDGTTRGIDIDQEAIGAQLAGQQDLAVLLGDHAAHVHARGEDDG